MIQFKRRYWYEIAWFVSVVFVILFGLHIGWRVLAQIDGMKGIVAWSSMLVVLFWTLDNIRNYFEQKVYQ